MINIQYLVSESSYTTIAIPVFIVVLTSSLAIAAKSLYRGNIHIHDLFPNFPVQHPLTVYIFNRFHERHMTFMHVFNL